jgi:hypothetical protein
MQICGGASILITRRVNGNDHLDDAQVITYYYGFKLVLEFPDRDTVQITVYNGEDAMPLGREMYGRNTLDE